LKPKIIELVAARPFACEDFQKTKIKKIFAQAKSCGYLETKNHRIGGRKTFSLRKRKMSSL
jgi:hypothetical protein